MCCTDAPAQPQRRRLLHGLGAALALGACAPEASIDGGFAGTSPERGHRLWQPQPSATAARVQRRCAVLILGAGVAGLAAARALTQQGVDDFAVLELEDQAGGNARAGRLGEWEHPLGAHYLPVPDDHAPEVQDVLEDLGLRQRRAGCWVYNPLHLCHSPQERVFFQGRWHDGLLPVDGVGAATLAQYRRFAALIARLQGQGVWTIPAQPARVSPVQRHLATISFARFLDANGLTDATLRTYLDYCCRDDYGAPAAVVSAWAGVHYFASRHGFAAPGQDAPEAQPVLTWPEGNAWLTRRLAQGLGARLHTGCVVLRVQSLRHAVEVDAWDLAAQQGVRWTADHAIVALPVHAVLRCVEGLPSPLRAAAQRTRHASWRVTNLHLAQPLRDTPPGPPLCWDNVIHGSAGLGYVNAAHQSLHPAPRATVLTHYHALGIDAAARQQLLHAPWTHGQQQVLADLAPAHPELPALLRQIRVTRYGHGMATPTPNVEGEIGLHPNLNLRKPLSRSEHFLIQHERLRFAHSDWSGYSVFEEAFTRGHHAAHGLGQRRSG
ncbi:MAG: NAD(P)/FAD-dependent oxidoreductase [Rhodoferax sp.]